MRTKPRKTAELETDPSRTRISEPNPTPATMQDWNRIIWKRNEIDCAHHHRDTTLKIICNDAVRISAVVPVAQYDRKIMPKPKSASQAMSAPSAPATTEETKQAASISAIIRKPLVGFRPEATATSKLGGASLDKRRLNRLVP